MQRIKFCAAVVCTLVLVTGLPSAYGSQIKSGTGVSGNDLTDSIQFLKEFHLGMTYGEVQQGLPKDLQQDTLAYSSPDGIFMLGVGKSSNDDWSAYFIFDTSDLGIKKPERLIEIDCSSTLPSMDESFESVVRRVSGAFGSPIKLDSTERTSRAGWQAAGGSVLTLEYTRIPGAARQTQCLVDFVVKRLPRRHPGRDTIA